MTAFTVKRIKSKFHCFTEPLEGLDEALVLDMVLVLGGKFSMGSPPEEPERADTEGPYHSVTVPSFLMGRYPITQAQWRFVAGLKLIDKELKTTPSRFKGDNHPVESVSWYEAVEFCRRLAKYTERPYRLPSEAEWEYACRAGTTTPFSFGKNLTGKIVNYQGSYTYNNGPEGEFRQETTPVDEFGIANALGLCDMHGNVWEWCADHWHENYNGAPEDGSAWLTEDESEYRVRRGGAWGSFPKLCRSATRYNSKPDEFSYNTGFRVCCRLPKTFQLPDR